MPGAVDYPAVPHGRSYTDPNTLLGAFGGPGPQGDYNGDRVVNSFDLNGVLSAFGENCD